MSKNSYTESQIRQMVEKISQIAEKNKGFIKINRIEDAASMAAYIAGYSSWQQYRKDQKKKKSKNEISIETNDEKNQIEEDMFSACHIDISSQEILIFKDSLQQLQKYSRLSPDFQENRQIISNLLIGEKSNKVTKSKEIFSLNIEPTLFMGNDFTFINSVKEQLIEQKQCILEFSSDKKENSNTFKLDPLNEIYCSEFFDILFDIQHQNYKDFGFLWSMIIKQITQQYYIKLNVEFLLKTLDLDFLVKFWLLLSHESHFLSNMIGQYFKNLSSINLQTNQVYVSASAQKKHWDNTIYLRKRLELLKEAYKSNIFSYNGQSLLVAFANKKNVQLYLPSKIEPFILKCVNLVMQNCIQVYEKSVAGLNTKYHQIFIVNKHEDLLKIDIDSEYFVYFCHAYPHQNFLLSSFSQIIFTKHHVFHDLNPEFIIKFYLNTQDLTENIFAKSGDILLNLNKNEAYLWKTLEKSDIEHLGTYNLIKIFAINNN